STDYLRLHELTLFVYSKYYVNRPFDAGLLRSFGVLEVLFQIGIPAVDPAMWLTHFFDYIINYFPLVEINISRIMLRGREKRIARRMVLSFELYGNGHQGIDGLAVFQPRCPVRCFRKLQNPQDFIIQAHS